MISGNAIESNRRNSESKEQLIPLRESNSIGKDIINTGVAA